VITKKDTKSGEPRYEVRHRGPDGKERSRTFRTKKEAERYVRNQQTAVDAGTWIDPTAGRTTLGQWATEWQRTVVHLRPKTRKIYADNLRLHILPVLGDHELAKLTPSMLRAWLADLASRPGVRGKVLSSASVSQAYRTLNRLLEAAVADELLGRNPLKGVKGPKVEADEMRFLTHEEVGLLADTIDERYRALVLVAAYTGLRASELVGLRRRHVDLLRRSLTVVEQVQYLDGEFLVAAPKSAAGRRSVALPRLVAAQLDSHLRTYAKPATDAIVFESPEGGYLRFDNFRNRFWSPAVKDAGLAPLRPHDLRHTCASLAIAAGADIKVLQRMLGHSSAVLTLDRYGHLFPGQAESVADRLDEMAQAAGIVQGAEVVAIARGRS
jgi:integrase